LLINGRPAQKISAADRGLHYGDGLFETIALRQGRLMLWDRHMARLNSGEQRLRLPPQSPDLLYQESLSVADRPNGVIKIIVTRGEGGRGYRPPAEVKTTRIVAFHDWPEYPSSWITDGLKLRLCATRLGSSPSLAGLKHLNRLEQVLARQEWSDPEIAEGVMLDLDGDMIEGTHSNLFFLQNQTLFTPDLSRCGVAGTVRDLVLELAGRMGMDNQVVRCGPEALDHADAVFITNALIGACPVARFEENE
jgi:4-amino-4-deoxychorismate lyase